MTATSPGPVHPSSPIPASRRRHRAILGGALLAVAGTVAFLSVIPHPAAQMGPPPAAGPGGRENVTVTVAETRDIPIVFSGLGTVTPLATVTTKSQISGYLTTVAFTEGQMVHKGDLLAEVDPRPYQALLEQYEGTLARDKALLDNARLDLARYQKLVQQDSVARQTLDTQAATVRQYEGTVRADQGQVDAEKVNLLYCRITAPIDGRVGLRQVDAGNYVQASDSTGIAVITSVSPISVVFMLSEDKLPLIRARLRAGATLPVSVSDRADTARLAEGTLGTLDNQIDTSTGTVKLRAVLPNQDDALFPNQFVNVRLLADVQKNVVAVPQSAIVNGPDGRALYVVDDGNHAHLRKIDTGAADAGYVMVKHGVAAGERVVIDGVDRLQDGGSVAIIDARAQTP